MHLIDSMSSKLLVSNYVSNYISSVFENKEMKILFGVRSVPVLSFHNGKSLVFGETIALQVRQEVNILQLGIYYVTLVISKYFHDLFQKLQPRDGLAQK